MQLKGRKRLPTTTQLFNLYKSNARHAACDRDRSLAQLGQRRGLRSPRCCCCRTAGSRCAAGAWGGSSRNWPASPWSRWLPRGTACGRGGTRPASAGARPPPPRWTRAAEGNRALPSPSWLLPAFVRGRNAFRAFGNARRRPGGDPALTVGGADATV